jgi:hypothetical protein
MRDNPWKKTTGPKPLTKKKLSSTSVSIGAARTKRQSRLSDASPISPDLRMSGAPPRSSTTAPGSSRSASLSAAREKARARKAITSLSGIALGDFVDVTWTYDPAYGNGNGYFEGRVTGLDGWLRAVDSQGVELYMPYSMIKVRKVNGSDT